MYNHKTVEKKWQKYWAEHDTFKTGTDPKKKNYYALDMFPFPSGKGLHVGHPEGYTATDIVSRMKRAQGYNVLHPMGWDAFGLPTEQYALKTGEDPEKVTKENIANFLKYDELEYICPNTQTDNKKLDYLDSKIAEKDNLIQSLYEDKVKGIITEDLFIKLSKQYETDKKTLLNRFQKEKEINKNTIKKEDLICNVKELVDFNENNVDRNFLLKLIDKIEIDDDNIDIYYKFKAI